MVEVLRDFGKIARGLDSIANIEFKEFELTRGQYMYLVRVCEHPGIIQEQLSELLLVDRATVSRAVKKLVSNGLIEKRDAEKNKKIKHLFPTERGLSIYPQIMAEHDYSNQAALAGLSERERTEFSELLKKVCQNIENEWEFVKKGNQRNY
ncbi:MAG: MarR family winged helix-turn-helix transcriptional regulator [Enterococcus sp.]